MWGTCWASFQKVVGSSCMFKARNVTKLSWQTPEKIKWILRMFQNLDYDVIFCTIFIAMEVLDGDDVRLSSRGRSAERDIVQVCELSEYSFIAYTFLYVQSYSCSLPLDTFKSGYWSGNIVWSLFTCQLDSLCCSQSKHSPFRKLYFVHNEDTCSLSLYCLIMVILILIIFVIER